MLVRYADWKRPTDEAYAFPLRPLGPGEIRVPPPGVRTDIRDVAREVMTPEDADRFEAQVDRWTGPEDEVRGERPYAVAQTGFEEQAFSERLDARAIDLAMRGCVLVHRASSGQVDFVLRDHHTLDVVLYHYKTTGELPRALFHADRHSDWCNDRFLSARRPQQAATWWALLEGLKRPDGSGAVLREADVFFTTAQAPAKAEHTRDVGASVRVPGCVDPDELPWERALERPGVLDADWVSLDLDFFQPARQLRLSKGLVRDDRFRALMQRAKVRLFVLSPQFLGGGDVIESWNVQGSLHSTLRLLNHLRSSYFR